MWRSLWRSIDRFSLQYFKYVINELRKIKVVDGHNRELVIDLLQSIVELVTYGDRQDPSIFEYFMEYQVLSEFVRVLKISRNSRIEAPLLQYLSIMIQNMNSDISIYYCFSNDYINNIIGHKFEFGGDLALYYVSFLRAVGNKLNKDTLCLLLKVHGDAVASFPLYEEALKFAHHGDKMIQTAIRALNLSIYNASDDMVYQYITTPPVSRYFSDMVSSLSKKFFHLDALVHDAEMRTRQKKEEILLETDKIVDDLYYLKDILGIGESRLSRAVTENLLRILIVPILLPLLQMGQSNGSNLSAVTSFYTISCLLQVIGGKGIFNFVAEVILYPHMTSSVRDAVQRDSTESDGHAKSILSEMGIVSSSHETEGAENNSLLTDTVSIKRSGILAHIFSENHSLLLASLFLLFILAETKDLHPLLAQMTGLSGMQYMIILNALLKVLASQPPYSILIQWHTGWFLRKLLICQGKGLSDHNFQLFNTSYQQSRECLQKELDGCWFDHIPEAFRNEWANCKAALQEASQCKDPFFVLELDVSQQTTDGDATSYCAWQRMVDNVKVFILHLQLKSTISKGELLEEPLLDSSAIADSSNTHASNGASASFGSEVGLGSGISCRISFSKAGIRDIYLIPVAKKTSGKVILAEKHPFRSQRGIVLAIAPLAGLIPKIDEDHPTWLHLQIREFEPKLYKSRVRGHRSGKSNHVADGRWTLGFPNAKACEAARLSILEETRKQRSSVESVLAPLLQNSCLGNLSESEDE
ncbi:protein TRANSPARENT TESTA 9-like isoform X2 [Malus sylvestris]|uniref:protein TRANSPARENT TESTA 9-like isoform X2 n=1 Tax=Malus sylvestris TaxID=3752 RepID=UPI0010AADF27|nr:protein TRANSPARENT TESTA 9-like isoform X2 [Malus domestica]XP_050114476.1 protein TRANSPARENT TESTA 9-like isoform X2 [Malus sylvestris]